MHHRCQAFGLAASEPPPPLSASRPKHLNKPRAGTDGEGRKRGGQQYAGLLHSHSAPPVSACLCTTAVRRSDRVVATPSFVSAFGSARGILTLTAPPTRSGGESKVDPEADRRASYGATNHASFDDARMSQPPGGPPMPPPGGGGSHDAMFGPDHLPRSVSEIGMMDYGTLGMKHGTVDHTTVDYWVWSGCPMWEAVHPYAAHVLVTKMSDRLWQRLMLYLNGARRDLVRLVARGDGLALWWELCKAFEVRNEYVADRLRERILDFRLGVGSRQNWELLTEGVERLRSLIELHRRASPIVYGFPYKIPITVQH